MNYIINPMWFYWINVADGLRFLVIVTAFLLGVTEIVMAIVAAVNYSIGKDYGPEDSNMKAAMSMIKPIIICGAVLVVSLVGVAFIPSKNTLIEMQVARYATYENAEWTVDAIKSAVDYIVNAITTVSGG